MDQITLTELKSEVLTEARVSLRLTVPLAFAQTAQVAIPVMNSVMMGWLGTQNLAAGALGVTTSLTLSCVYVGILKAGGAIAAEAFGANNIERVSRITSQGLWLVAILSLPAMLLLWNCDSILLALGQTETTVALTKTYLHALVWGFPAEVGFTYLKYIATAINFSQFVTVIIVISLLLNAPINYVLMFGHLGLPDLGLAGIGWGTTLVYWVTLLASVGLIYFHPFSRNYQLFRYLHQFDKEIFFKVITTGWPMGIQMAMEAALFTVMTMLMGSLGSASLAAYEIALQTSDIFFAIPIAFSSVTTARVGQILGEKNTGASLFLPAFVNFAFSLFFAFVVALGFEMFASRIASIYLDINNPDNAVAISRATSFIKLAGLFQIFYSIQYICIGALLGLQDTRMIMLINIFSFWCVGLGGAYLMGMILGWREVDLWYGLILASATSSIFLMVSFYSKAVSFRKT